jgi:hypothetical protein
MHENVMGPAAICHESSVAIVTTSPSPNSMRSSRISFGGPNDPLNFL